MILNQTVWRLHWRLIQSVQETKDRRHQRTFRNKFFHRVCCRDRRETTQNTPESSCNAAAQGVFTPNSTHSIDFLCCPVCPAWLRPPCPHRRVGETAAFWTKIVCFTRFFFNQTVTQIYDTSWRHCENHFFNISEWLQRETKYKLMWPLSFWSDSFSWCTHCRMQHRIIVIIVRIVTQSICSD